MTKKRLLITGAGGLLGYALCRRAVRSWDVYGVYHRGEIHVKGVTPVKVDLADPDQLQRCFREIVPQAVIHAAAVSQPNDCQLQPRKSARVNVGASIRIAGLCTEAAIPLVFTSSDLVFNGLSQPYDETCPVSPICVYGAQKAAAEKAMRVTYPDVTVCRLPLMLGHAPGTGSGFLGHMVRALLEKRELKLFTDEFRTPADTDSVAAGLLMALEKGGALLHLGGRQRLSRLSIGCLVADILKADHSLLRPLLIKNLPMPAPRSPDVSLQSERAYALGYAPADFTTAMEKLVPLVDREIRERQR